MRISIPESEAVQFLVPATGVHHHIRRLADTLERTAAVDMHHTLALQSAFQAAVYLHTISGGTHGKLHFGIFIYHQFTGADGTIHTQTEVLKSNVPVQRNEPDTRPFTSML